MENIKFTDFETIKTFKINDKVINLKNGPYGYYLQVKSNNKKPKNIALNKKLDTNYLHCK